MKPCKIRKNLRENREPFPPQSPVWQKSKGNYYSGRPCGVKIWAGPNPYINTTKHSEHSETNLKQEKKKKKS